MFKISEDKTIHITRGDIAVFGVKAKTNGTAYTFKEGDVLRINVTGKKDCERVLLRKNFTVVGDTEEVTITLTGEDTGFGGVINKPVEFWYEIELNPETEPQTIVGYDEDGPKIFRLYPEGGEIKKEVTV